MTRTSRKVEFPGATGAPLAARLELPDGTPRAYAVFAHCFTCGKDNLAASRISRALTEGGLAVLRFDFTGLGESGGDFSETTFTSNVGDLVRAAGYLREHFRAPSVLIGHSLGGAAVLAAAHQVPETRAVVTIAAPADPAHVVESFRASRAEIEANGSAEVCLGGRRFRIRREFLDDVAAQPQLDRIRKLGVPLLVLHSPTDRTVGVDNARVIFEAARHPKSYVALDGADHLLTDRAQAGYTGEMLLAWVQRYLPAGEAEPARPPAAPVVVAEAGGSPFGQRIRAGRHELAADEPPPRGRDLAPTPYDLLLAALGACSSMAIRSYAERAGWPLENVTVSLRRRTENGVDHLTRLVRLEGPLDADQRASLLGAAEKCPVHRTLASQVVIETSEEVAGPA
jgi:putative redox protein